MIPGQPDGEIDLADALRAAVLAVPGVAGLYDGPFGEIATYLPGRRVGGIRHDDRGTDVHVTVLAGVPVRPAAEAVRRAVAHLAPGAVTVTVEDVAGG